MAQNVNMTLRGPIYNPTVYTPMEYKPQVADVNIFQRSLAQREARRNQAVQAKNAIDLALGEVESKLNPNETEWFNNYKNDINNQIAENYDAGDYGAAFRTATALAGQTAKDTQILGRIRANEEFNKEVQTQQARRDKGEISQNTYDWWLSNNPYSYKDITNDNGNVVGGSSWTADSRPVADINWASQAMAAFKLISPDKYSWTGGNTTTNADGTGNGNRTSNSYERVSAKDIRDNIERMLSATPDGYRQAEQAYDVAKYEYNNMVNEWKSLADDDPKKQELRDKLDKREQLMYQNGSPISYKEYYARMITDELYSEGLAYDWRVDSSITSTDNQMTGVSSRTSPGVVGGQTPYPVASLGWLGPNVQQGSTYNMETVNNSANGITKLYED